MDDPLHSVRQELLLKRDPSGASVEAAIVILQEENREAATIYMLTRNQIILAPSGHAIDISIPAVKIAMDVHGVVDQKECLAKVLRLFHHFEEKRREHAG